MARFTDEEITYFDQQAHMFVETTNNWRDWCPFETIPYKRKSEWKIIEKIRDAATSLEGSRTNLAATSYTVDEAPLIWFGHHFEWTEAEVMIARQTGNNISTDEIRLSGRRIDEQIERLILQGTMTWETPVSTGILSGATDNNGGLDDDPWNTIGNPYDHAFSGYNTLLNNGYDPPFTWLLGHNLRAGLAQRDLTTSSKSARDAIADAFEIDNFQFTRVIPNGGAQTRNDLTIYPFGISAGDDSMWAMMKADPNNFIVQEVFAPKLTIIPEMDERRKVFYGRNDWFGVLKLVHANSVVDEDQVDLVT